MNNLQSFLSSLSSDQLELLANKFQITTNLTRTPNTKETGQTRLAAYVRLDPDTSIESLREYAENTLPSYMQPSLYIPLDEIPRLSNGKYDIASLPANAPAAESTQTTAELQLQETPDSDSTVTDQLIDILSDLLRVDDLRPTDNFFEIGGDSITAIRFVSRAREAGLHIDVPSVTNSRSLAEIVSQNQHQPEKDSEIDVAGKTPLTPIQQWFFDQLFVSINHWNRGGVFELQPHVDPHRLKAVIEEVIAEYPALGSSFHNTGKEWTANIPDTSPPVDTVSIIEDGDVPTSNSKYHRNFRTIQNNFALNDGWMFKVQIVIDRHLKRHKLFWVAHHLVIDTLSESVLFENIATKYTDQSNVKTSPTTKATSLREWAIATAQRTRKLGRQLPQVTINGKTLTEADCATLTQKFEQDLTDNIQLANKTFNTGTHELLLTALATAWFEKCGIDQIDIDFETHGRDAHDDAGDVTASIGWFTSFFPLTISIDSIDGNNDTESDQNSLLMLIDQVKQNVRSARDYHKQSFDHSADTTQKPETTSLNIASPILFNFSGVSENSSNNAVNEIWTPLELDESIFRDPANNRSHWMEINAGIKENKLFVHWRYPGNWVDYPAIEKTNMQELTEAFARSLDSLIEFSKSQNDIQYTPGDFPELDFSQNELDDLISSITFKKTPDR